MPRPPAAYEYRLEVIGRAYQGFRAAMAYSVHDDNPPSRTTGQMIADAAKRHAGDFASIDDCRVTFTEAAWHRRGRTETRTLTTTCLRGWRHKSSAGVFARSEA